MKDEKIEDTPTPPVDIVTGDDGVAREYFFPGLGKTVTATSVEDAQTKVEALVEADK